MDNTEKQIFQGLFLGGKSLEELNFPEDWEYDFVMCRWSSENHYLTVKEDEFAGKEEWREYKVPLYITDEMLAKAKLSI